MIDREVQLRSLNVGDIFHANNPYGASLICLVTSVTEDSVHARTVTTQIAFQFDRRTGIAEWGEERVLCTIDSIAVLPAEIHKVILGLDDKFRLGRDPKLTEAEKQALIYVDGYYPSNPL